MRRRLLIILLLSLAATTALAATETTAFFIERIDVRNLNRASRDVVIAESRLREGHEYTEKDLHEAGARLERAPYLLSADLSLEKGSERGRFVLVISVNEAKPLFFNINASVVHASAKQALARDNNPIGASDSGFGIGYRYFIGNRGAIHAGIEGLNDNRDYTSDYNALAVGYTQYDLFGTRAFATLNLKKALVSGSSGASIVPQVVVGIPLSLNQTLTLDYDELREQQHHDQRLFTARWSYNTTNRPFSPTKGTLLTLTPVVASSDRAYYFLDLTPGSGYTLQQARSRSYGLEASASHWFELNDRDSVSLGGEVDTARTTERGTVNQSFDSRYSIAEVTFSHSFWDANRVAKDGDQRIELNVRYGSRSTGYTNYVSFNHDADARRVAVSWVRHNAWGTFRLGAGYAW